MTTIAVMIDYIKSRYNTGDKVIHALAHFMLTGLATAFFVRYTVLGLAVAIALPLAIESYQWSRGSHDIKDAIFDFCEHFLGGMSIGLFFWSTQL